MFLNDVFVLKGVDQDGLSFLEEALKRKRAVDLEGDRVVARQTSSCYIGHFIKATLKKCGYRHKGTIYHKGKMVLEFEKEKN